jgi:(p)ppGpp synthase/HD superfamily hydrolase
MARGASRSLSEQSGRGYPFALEKESLRLSGRDQAALLKTAEGIAEFVHGAQQKRRDGSPYMNHVREVVDGVKTPKAKLAAYLHDTIEDGGITPKELRDEGIPEDVIEAVQALTMPPPAERGMSYQEHIERIVKPNRIATEVKIADLRSNLKDNDNPGQVKRYERALKALLDA